MCKKSGALYYSEPL